MMHPTELPDDRAAARRLASELVVHAQSDAGWVADALDSTMIEARRRGWDDIRLALLHALIVYSWKNSVRSTSELIDELEHEADRIGSSALIAVAMVDRIRYLRSINGQAPFDLYAAARVRLQEQSGSVADRFSGLLNLALEFDLIGLNSTAAGVLADAEAVLDEMDDPTHARNALANNQTHRLLRAATDRVMEGDPDAAADLLAQSDEQSARIGPGLPDGWAARRVVHRRTVEALVHDHDVSAREAARLVDSLDDFDDDQRLFLDLVRPLREQDHIPDADVLDSSEHPQVAWFMRARSLRRAGADACELLEAIEGLNRAISARAVLARSELAAGMAAMVDAQLLARERGELAELAVTDPLTRLGNRRAWQNGLDRLDGSPATVVLIDLDRFKSVNDSHGHVVGDGVLQRCADAIASAAAVARPDVVARIGGDEFGVVFAGECRSTARSFVDALDTALAAADWPAQLQQRPTLSTGVGTGSSATELMATADEHLYAMKRNTALEIGDP